MNYLANLIADGILDIKIAITESNYKTGIYHEKVGIIEDDQREQGCLFWINE